MVAIVCQKQTSPTMFGIHPPAAHEHEGGREEGNSFEWFCQTRWTFCIDGRTGKGVTLQNYPGFRVEQRSIREGRKEGGTGHDCLKTIAVCSQLKLCSWGGERGRFLGKRSPSWHELLNSSPDQLRINSREPSIGRGKHLPGPGVI